MTANALSIGADPNYQDNKGFPMLSAVVAAILNAGAYIDIKMQSDRLGKIKGYTALHFAVSKGSEDIVRLLLDGGADVDAVTDDHFLSNAPKVTSLLLAANDDNL